MKNMVHLAKASTTASNFETLKVTVPKEYVYHVELNRPDKLNAMNHTLWEYVFKNNRKKFTVI